MIQGNRTLDELAAYHGTDKASVHPSIRGHDYARHYEEAFNDIRFSQIKLLEIGVGGGESIRTWLDYFPNASVYGVDVVSGTNPWNTVDSGVHPRYRFVTGNQSSFTFWKCFIADYFSDWDVIVDDGGHQNYEIIQTFNWMWPHIKPGGLYCIEDLAVGYGAGSIHVRGDFPRHMDYIKEMLDKINWEQDNLDSMYYCRELAIIRKQKPCPQPTNVPTP